MLRNPGWFPAAYVGALIAQLVLAVGLTGAHWHQTGQLPLSGSPQRGMLAAGTESVMKPLIADLLRQRSRAILDQNRVAFLRTVDPQSSRFNATQARLFQRVIELPLARWEHHIRGTVSPAMAEQWLPVLQRRYGAPVWLAEVRMRHGFTAVPNFELAGTHYLTFVLRKGAWYLAADDDLDSSGLISNRQLWDFGPVVAASTGATLVLGHRVQQGFVQRIGRLTSRARSAVVDLFGTEIAPVVVIVPGDLDEARKLLPGTSAAGTASTSSVHLSALSAVTTAADSDPRHPYVVLNTEVMAGLSEPEQAIVLRHESAHVATRDVSSKNPPVWLSEGIAEYAAYIDSGRSQGQFAPDLVSSVRSGKLPRQLPTRQSFESTADAGDATAAALAYRYAWSACVLLVKRVGFAELTEIYRRSAEQTGDAIDTVWPQALQDRLSLSREDFVRLWQEYLVTSFATP